MSSQAQIDANRANARNSTGPRTQEGKQRVAKNATRHGLFSRSIILPGEDPEEFAALHDGFYARLKPADALERVYVDRIVYAAWKLARIPRLEAAAFEYGYDDDFDRDRQFRCDITADAMNLELEHFERYAQYQNAIERQMDRALNELRKLQKERREDSDLASDLAPAPKLTPTPTPKPGVQRRDTSDPIAQSDPFPDRPTDPEQLSKEENQENKPNPSATEPPESPNPLTPVTPVTIERENFEFKPNSTTQPGTKEVHNLQTD